MTAFTEWPGALVLARTLFALVAFCFMPGYLLLLARTKAKKIGEALLNAPAETILESVVISLALLALAVMLLMFSIGFSAIALLALELMLLYGAWRYWKKRIG